MKSIIRNIMAIIIITCHSLHCTPDFIALARAITVSCRHAKTSSARDTLMREFKKHQSESASFDTRTLSTIVTAYHYKNETLLFEQHSNTLYDAVQMFSDTPGFSQKIFQLLENAEDASFIQGHMFELETALKLHEQEEYIQHFGYTFRCPVTLVERSADLVTADYLVECKNIRWSNYHLSSESSKAIRKQLRSYKLFEQDPNYNRANRTFLLWSKQPITPAWRAWLEENEIAYEEDSGH